MGGEFRPGPGDFEPYETILGALRVYKTVNGDLRVGPTRCARVLKRLRERRV